MKKPLHNFISGKAICAVLFSLYSLCGKAQFSNTESQNNNTLQQQNSLQQNTIQKQQQNSIQQQTSVKKQNPVQQQQNSNSSQSYIKRSFNYYPPSPFLDSARHYADKNPLLAIDFINKAIEESIHKNDIVNESTAYLILGNIQQRLQQHDLAIENYKKCINVYKVKNNRMKADYALHADEHTLFTVNKQMALSYMALNELGNANDAINTCLTYTTELQGDLLSAKRIAASIKLKQNKPEESLFILNTVLLKEQQINHAAGQVETYIALGEVYLDQKNEDKAVEYFTNAKTLAEKSNLSNLALKANDCLAKVFRKQKNVSKELEARNSNITINTNDNNTQALVKENIEIGNAYLNANQPAIAQTYFDKGLLQFTSQNMAGTTTGNEKSELFVKSSDLEATANTYKILAEEYLKRNEPGKALAYFNKYAALQDSIKHVRQRELNEALNISNSLGKNQQRIDLLEKERQLSERSLEILKQDKDLKEDQLGFKNIIIGILIFFLVFMLLAGYFVIKSSKEKRKVNQMLALKSLRGQMNPHFIFNALNSVNHYISQNDERKANRYLSDFSKLMRMVMDSSKHTLVPLTEELEMLRLYLQLEHARFNDKFDYTFEISETISDADFELPPMLIQPYLENAIWHGLRYLDAKGQMALLFEEEHHELTVTITDTGIGRNKSLELKTHNQKKQASIGMQNIENRIVIMNDLFGTNIRVEVTDAYPGTVNCGTKVKLYIPQQKQLHA